MKTMTKELETKDFIYYTDKEGEQVTMIRKSDGSIVSDNYFAENDLFERMVAIANGRESYVYLRNKSKKYLKEYGYPVCNICNVGELDTNDPTGVCNMCADNRVEDGIWTQEQRDSVELRTDKTGAITTK